MGGSCRGAHARRDQGEETTSVRMPKPLTGSVLSRLAAEALATCLGQAEAFEVAMHPGCCLVLSGEPVADVNYLVAGRAPRRVITLPQPA